ncbi:hypothetical protein StoSoilA2_02560 [Arthrobacter sp. StoSoilA2]|nr:hypothetical protein StoSoilA2_02560 [Arthrobacter sp. StoSoilA2]
MHCGMGAHGLQAGAIAVSLLNFIDQPRFMGTSGHGCSAASPAQSDAAQDVQAYGFGNGGRGEDGKIMQESRYIIAVDHQVLKLFRHRNIVKRWDSIRRRWDIVRHRKINVHFVHDSVYDRPEPTRHSRKNKLQNPCICRAPMCTI